LKPPISQESFAEPWQAQALAIAMSLQESGVITARQWSEALGAAIERAQIAGDPDRGDTYYLHVLDALEHLLAENNLVSGESLVERKAEWEAAYRRTPHGQPVEL
jgi:nitrile hydratase accessory protein